VVRLDGEVTGLQHVSKVSDSLVYRQELPVLCAVFLLYRTELPGEEGEGLQDILNPLLEFEASVTRASGAVESGCAST
jgi:hypothetical protein